MQKIRIIAIDAAKYQLVRALQGIGSIDMRKSKLKLDDDSPGVMLPEISEQIVRVRGALAILNEPKASAKTERAKHMPLERLLREVQELSVIEKIFEHSEERKSIVEQVKEIDEALSVVDLFTGMHIDFGALKSDALAFYAFTTDARSFASIAPALKAKRVEHELISKTLKDKRVLVFMAFARGQRAELDEALKGVKLAELNIENRLLTSTPDNVIKRLNGDRARATKRIAELDSELGDIGAKHYNRIASLSEMLDIEYERANVTNTFKRTSMTFVVEGWVPKRRMKELHDTVSAATDGNFEIEDMKDKELAPTLLNRPKFLKPFDYLMEFYSVPRSDEIDPTWIFIFSLSIFYGIMVSDVGYGLMSFVLAWIIINRTKPDGLLNNVARIWRMFSIPIIIFGLLSNEFLGYSLAQFNGIRIFDWINGVPQLILITVLFGVTMVVVGQLFSFYNRYRHHEKKLAVSKLISIFAIVFGTIAVGGWFFNAFNQTLTLASTAIALAAFAITAAMSGIEATELTSLITHPLSYSRLLGFGLASIILSFLIDQAFTPRLSQGALAFIAFSAIFIVLHSLNMLLSIFEGIIQGARLDFVEFFSKFYMGNGVRFRPYYFKRRYTKD